MMVEGSGTTRATASAEEYMAETRTLMVPKVTSSDTPSLGAALIVAVQSCRKAMAETSLLELIVFTFRHLFPFPMFSGIL